MFQVLALIMPSDLFSSHMLLLFDFEIFILFYICSSGHIDTYMCIYVINIYVKNLKIYVQSWGKTLGHAMGSIPIPLFPLPKICYMTMLRQVRGKGVYNLKYRTEQLQGQKSMVWITL